jgi:CubicO group peptidase (beta-lactamase class C family)
VTAGLSRRGFTGSLLAGAVVWPRPGRAFAAPQDAAAGWERYPTPEAAGFGLTGLARMEEVLYGLPTTSLMIVKSGRVAYSYGDIAQPSYLASARKSVMSMLYGKYVESGVIDLDRTLGDLGIDDVGGLLPVEKTARVRDLLVSSSGVYHPAGSPGGAPIMERGSKVPGSYFLYNNWDFNVAGAVFEQLTGKTIFQALEEDLARPLGFQDFDRARQRMLGFKNGQSRFPAYHLFLSGRDMARLGACMVRGGRWNGRQVVPEAWVRESTRLHVPVSRMAGPPGPMGYGYLWWIPSESRRGPEWSGSFMANGNYGQFLLALPALDLVIVHRRALTDEFAIARNLGATEVNPPGVSAETFLHIADMVLEARIGGRARPAP